MKNKKLVINMIASFVAFAVNLGIGFFLSPYIIKTVGVEAYGFVSLGNNFIQYASLLTIALNSMAGRFITIEIHRNDMEKANRYFTSVIIANLFMALVMLIPSVFVVLFINKIVQVPTNILLDVRLLWGFLFFNFLFSLVTNAYGVCFFATNNLYISSKRQIESNVLRAVVIISLFCFFKPSVWYLGFTATLTSVYLTVANVYYCNRLLPNIKYNKKYFDFRSIVEIVSSGIWNVFNNLSGIMSQGLDLLIANLFVGATAMGTMSVSKTIPTMILSLFAMLAANFAPNITKAYAKKDYESIKQQLIFSMKMLGMLSSIPMAILFVAGMDFYKLWVPTQDYKFIYYLTIAASLGSVFSLPLEPLWSVFTVTNKIKTSSIVLFVTSLFTIIAVFIGVSLTNDVNLRLYIIAGTSTFFGILRVTTFLPIYGAYVLNFKWHTFYPTIIKNAISIAVLVAALECVKFFMPLNSWIGLIIFGIISGIVGIIINGFLLLTKEERKSALLKSKEIIFKKGRA